ncbi:MAG: DMT family transporter [Hyphomonadaceae bacterium]
MNRERFAGAAYGLAAAALFGMSTPFAKALLGVIDPWLLAGLLYLGSGFGLLLCRAFARQFSAAPREAPLRRPDLPWLAGAVLAGGVAGPVLLMIGLTRTPASSAALLLNLEGLATMAIAWLVFREHADRRILIGAFAILAGAALLSWRGEAAGFSFGALAIAGACVAWGIDNNLTRKVSAADPMQIAMVKGLAAGGVNFALALGQGAPLPASASVVAAGCVGFLGYGVSLVFFVLALRRVGAARTGAYFSAAPFIGATLGVVLLAEPASWRLLAAAGLMAFGLYLHLAERHEHAHVHEPLEHEHAHTHDAHHQHAHAHDAPPGEPHAHRHRHERMAHSHPHFPDLHHRHDHPA